MSWVEVSGDGWRWMEMGARFSNTCFSTIKKLCLQRNHLLKFNNLLKFTHKTKKKKEFKKTKMYLNETMVEKQKRQKCMC